MRARLAANNSKISGEYWQETPLIPPTCNKILEGRPDSSLASYQHFMVMRKPSVFELNMDIPKVGKLRMPKLRLG